MKSAIQLQPMQQNSCYHGENISTAGKEQLLSSSFAPPQDTRTTSVFGNALPTDSISDEMSMSSMGSERLGNDFLVSNMAQGDMSEPPPFEDFKYDWNLPDLSNFQIFGQNNDFDQNQQLLSPAEHDFIFGSFLRPLEENPNFMFNPELPNDLPQLPPYLPSNDMNDPLFSLDSPFEIGQSSSSSSHQPTVSSSTSLSPRTQNLVLSSSPKQKNDQLASGDPIPSIPAKRKSGDDIDKSLESSRRASNPRLSQIQTKSLSRRSSQSSSPASSPKPEDISPTMEISCLSIDGDNRNGNSSREDHRSSAANDKPTTPSSPASSSHEVEPKREPHDSSEFDETSSNFDNAIDMKVDGKLISAKSSRKPYKELLTEEEKRANHIASEQKRRNTIRAGFKELTDIIPTLKNVNNSKSTILFKAVDYIKYLERRNRNLKERANILETRVELELRSGKRLFPHHSHSHFGLNFPHARVGPMPMGPSYGMLPNMLGINHPQQQIMPQQMQNMYYMAD
ncbi:7446_t:CDS:2 [Paraglomus brasilianum]|uniref:7446_t:CDS:1 n=1 Tax=Paraglomus brasilianum TaxID=144538 RepID=A0A9N9BUU1_9GLOM|nr:7446_t:CDS:2 [Paraglomus brasilianum]